MFSESNLSQMVRKLFDDTNEPLTVGDIYDAVEGNYPLTDKQKEFTRYDEPLFHHEIRAIINELFQKGEIRRVGRGKYKKA